MYCSRCGDQLPENANFCPRCGTRTEKGKKENAPLPWEGIFSEVGEELEKAFSTASREIEKAFETVKEEIRKATTKHTVVCSSCGQENLSDAHFCRKCGKELSKEH